jgi:acyl-CoA synthetase (AMP-forming)/AMP-acid ligase II
VSRRALDARVLELIAEGPLGPVDDARFGALALELFRHQLEQNAPYRRLCEAFGIARGQVSHWREIPPVPTGAFKEARLACFPAAEEVRTFRTSGSTGERRGELHLDTLELYEASLAATFGAFVCFDVERIRFLVLAPSLTAAPDSSLSYMFDAAVRRWGTQQSRCYLRPEGWDPAELIADLESVREPVAVVGTAFAFVHLLDALAERGSRLALPEASRVLETGGFKGRSRSVEREELHAAIADSLGVARSQIVNQYGMCELGSQFYESTLRDRAPTRTKRVPPWVRTRVVDPETLDELPPGAEGLLIHYDLANTGSVLAVQTSDRGRSIEGGFEVLGRLPGAESRGCSIAADALLQSG